MTLEQIQQKLKHLPDKPGAYMMKDERGEVIYVGKAASLRSRVRSYFQKGQSHTAKVLVMMTKVADVDWLVTDTEVAALMLECNLIKQYKPHYNVRLRDDKHYPYVCVTTSEPFPRVLVVRRVKSDGNKYFGPYADSTALRESLRLIRKVFRIRSCNKKLTGTEHDKPCLNYHMGQCDGCCAALIDRHRYSQQVQDTILFLEGRQEPLLERLEADMLQAAEELEFERAARLRDQIDSIRRISSKQKMITTEMTDQDIMAIATENGWTCVQVLLVRNGKLLGQDHFFLEGVNEDPPEESLGEFIKQYYRDTSYIPKEILLSHEPVDAEVLGTWLSERKGKKVDIAVPKRGDKRRLVEMAMENATLVMDRQRSQEQQDENAAVADMEALADVLDLQELPERIEAYDISNIQGTEAVGSMVVFEHGMPAKSEYRRFKIRAAGQPDDFGMMREVLTRRLSAASKGDPKFTKLPDLMLIDGGKGQLHIAVEVISQSEFDIRVISLAKRLEEIFVPGNADSILLPRDSGALHLVQRIRDEAHRFALAYHHKLREKTVRKSILDSIPGVGEHRRKALIKRFGSVAGVKRASLEELSSIPGITKDVAQAIYETLHTD